MALVPSSIFTTFFLLLTHFQFSADSLTFSNPSQAHYALIMQDNSEQQYLTNPMDSPPELSQSSYSYMTYMGFEGDADVR
jgi:hypothetical protein